MSRTFIKYEMHPSGHSFHTEKTIVECEAEGCTNPVRVNESYGFAGLFVAMTGPKAINPIVVEHLMPVGVMEQDFCCSIACAVKALEARTQKFVEVWQELEKTATYQVGSAPKEEDNA